MKKVVVHYSPWCRLFGARAPTSGQMIGHSKSVIFLQHCTESSIISEVIDILQCRTALKILLMAVVIPKVRVQIHPPNIPLTASHPRLSRMLTISTVGSWNGSVKCSCSSFISPVKTSVFLHCATPNFPPPNEPASGNLQSS